METSKQSIPSYKLQFLQTCLEEKVLTFGDYTLKSGRQSPYFFNAGLFYRADLVRSISSAFAQTLHVFLQKNEIQFDILFGPAYKGIPLAVATAARLADLDTEIYGRISYSFNRKEAKDHGEGGTVVGAPLQGKKVVIVDDVITAGTASQEAINMIRQQGAEVVALIIALDRMEIVEAAGGDAAGPTSAVKRIEMTNSIPVVPILNLDDIINGLTGTGSPEQVERLEIYRARYGIPSAVR